jgi:hypothetical protein
MNINKMLNDKELDELANAILDENYQGIFNTFSFILYPKNIFDKIDEDMIDEIYNQIKKRKLEGKTSHYNIRWEIVIE